MTTVTFNKPQSLAHMALQPGNTVTIPWGRGVGKSWFQRRLWYLFVHQWDNVLRAGAMGQKVRGVRVVHLMPTFKQCKDIHGDLTDAELAPWGEWGFLGARIDHTSWRIRFPGGSWIQWFGTREANAARGLRPDIVTVDECDDVDPAVLDAIIRPWFSEPWSMRTLCIGGTPRRGRMGLLYRGHKAWLDKIPHQISVHATYRDAPANVDQAYVELQRATTDPVVFQREWECNFDSAEGMVYAMFDREVHVKAPPENTRWTEFLVGIDHGYEDPGVFLLIGVIGNGRDATCWVLDEVYQHRETPSWWTARAKKLAEQWNLRVPYRMHDPRAIPSRWFADPSRPDVIQEYVRAGIRVEPAKNSIEDGVLAVADRLVPRLDPSDKDGKRRMSKLYIHPRCKMLIEEMGKYKRKRDPRNPDRVLEDIVDADNHCFAAGTMVMTDRGEVPIEDIRAGMRVLTRQGFYHVKAAGMTREAAETWTLDVRNDGVLHAAALRGTGEHLVWVESAPASRDRATWIPLRELRCLHGLTSLERPENPDDALTPEQWAERIEGRTMVEGVALSGIVEPVYDLTVDGPPEFFANGILVHNCMDSLRYSLFTRFGGPDRTRHESGPGWGAPQAA